MQMYGATKPKPGMKPGMKPGGSPRMMAEGDLGAPADMEAPPAGGPEDDEAGETATLQSISDKLDAIMEALQIPMPGEGDESGAPPPGGPGGPGGPNTPAGNPEMQP